MPNFFHNTLTPWQWVLLALVPLAIIALYFLKLRRQPLEVPSTHLWKRTLEDLHVNSLWQRLRQNLLLFLQLLLVALAMLALLRPGWEGTTLEGDRVIFLIDNSASMSATDVQGAATRLEEAKELVGGLIDQMEPGMTAMIISFADTAQVVQEFTENRRLLRERLATIQATNRGTDLKAALELAQGLANSRRIATPEKGEETNFAEAPTATLYIFSDGLFKDVEGFSLGTLQPRYVPIGSFDAQNLAITSFAVRRSEERPEQHQAFVQVSNASDATRQVVVEILFDDQFLDARQIDVSAGESNGLVFPLADVPPGKLTARLKYSPGSTPPRDVLELDDTGYAVLNEIRPGRVLVITPGNLTLELALSTERAARLANIQFQTPDVLQSEQYQRDADSGTYDLIIYDQCAPATMPRANTLFVSRLPPPWKKAQKDFPARDADNPQNESSEKEPRPPSVSVPQIIDWDRSHPLMASVELGNVDIAEGLLLAPPPGATVLIDSTAGPLAAIAPRDSYQDVVLGFEIEGLHADGSPIINTNWPRNFSFPTFWLNALEYLACGSEESQLATFRPGQSVALPDIGNVGELTVIDPTGKEYAVRRRGADVFQFHDTHRLGIYDVRQHDRVIHRFAVNLFDRQESDVRLRPTQDPESQTVRPADLRIGQVDVAAVATRTPARKELWKAVLACALSVLLLEWYLYNRRVYL